VPSTKNEPSRKKRIPEKEQIPPRPRKRVPCRTLRLAVIIGSGSDKALRGAENWSRGRARALGGTVQLWRSYSNSDPLEHLSATDISGGGRTPLGRHHRNPVGGQSGYNSLLQDCSECQCRIEEMVIFHHGTPVDEAEVADQLLKIFRIIRVPVCRVVWWACNAAIDLDVTLGGFTDSFMKGMGGLAYCDPCGCSDPIELIWPTVGKCGINKPTDPEAALTLSGRVLRARWGYPQPGGGLGVEPDPNDPQPTRNPPDRDPPYGQDPPEGPGSVLGLPVTQGPLD